LHLNIFEQPDGKPIFQHLIKPENRFIMARNVIVFLLLTSLLVFLPASSSHGDETDHAFQRAETYLKNGLYLEAISDYQDIADHSEEYGIRARALFMIGDIYSYFLDDYDTALKYYYLVKTKYSGSPFAANAWFNSGMIFYERGRYREALTQFRTYLKNDPGGVRKETAEYMMEACLRETPSALKKKEKSVTPAITEGERIRVLIKASARELIIDAPSSVDVKNLSGEKILKKIEGGILEVGAAVDIITINGETLDGGGFVLTPSMNGKLKADGKRYRGEIRVIKSKTKGMDVINIVNLEEYLYGVVPKEMSPSWPLEALKAQAVVARTFALYQKEKNRESEFDVSATTMSQVYGGFEAETASAIRAVDDTRGQVLYHNGKRILAYYHSNSGGATEDAKNVWTADIPYLKGIRDEYSMNASGHRWTLSLAPGDLSKALAKSGIRVGEIHDLVPVEVSPSGRIVKLKVVHSGGEAVFRSNDFRLRVNPQSLKSTLFVLMKEGNRIRFDGKGYGHGVGLSQWGAYEMARRGFSCLDILKHYYWGIEIRSTHGK
jgi:stage II sporulation protein D